MFAALFALIKSVYEILKGSLNPFLEALKSSNGDLVLSSIIKKPIFQKSSLSYLTLGGACSNNCQGKLKAVEKLRRILQSIER